MNEQDEMDAEERIKDAAPDMLAALKDLLEHIDGGTQSVTSVMVTRASDPKQIVLKASFLEAAERARAAIAKAEGREP